MSARSPLSGVKRKSDFGAVRSAYDPEPTSENIALASTMPPPGGSVGNEYGTASDLRERRKRCVAPRMTTVRYNNHAFSLMRYELSQYFPTSFHTLLSGLICCYLNRAISVR